MHPNPWSIREKANRLLRRPPPILFALIPAIVGPGSSAFAQDIQQNDGQASTAVAPAPDQPPVSHTAVNADREVEEVGETIVVTGSRIPRRNLTAVSPVTVVGEEEVKLEGATAAEELLNTLPQVAPSEGAFISGQATGLATVDLRNLGPSRTLVLVNGRRLGPGDPHSPLPDLNMIPSAIIRRVEVLTGGATSVYGSDAVSGVVNFILDTKIEGLRIDGQTSWFQHDNRNGSGLRDALIASGNDFPTGNSVDGGRQDINAAFGTAFLDGRAHVTVYAGYRHFDPLNQNQRDYSACPAAVSEQDNRRLRCAGSAIAFPGNFLTNFADSNSIPGVFTIGPNRAFVPGITFFNFAPWVYYQRSDRRWTGGGFLHVELSEAFRPYAELMYLDDRAVAQAAPSGSFGDAQTINCDNPLLSEQQRSLICITGNFIGEFPIIDDEGNVLGIEGSPIDFTDPVTGATYRRARLIVLRRGSDTGPRLDDLRHKTFRALGGVKGGLGRGISYDASLQYSRAKMSNAHLNDFSRTRLRRALDVVADPATGEPVCRTVLTGADPECVPWDIFSLEGVSAEASAYVTVPSFRKGSVAERIANANATVDLGEWGVRSPWADEAPAANLGAEYRKAKLDYHPDPQSADLTGSLEELPVSGSVDVKELFAELRMPLISERLVHALSVEGGYRRSWYGNPESSVSSTAYKVALDFSPVRGVRLRASQQRAVRAPNVVELLAPSFRNFFDFDRCAGPAPQATPEQCARTGVSPGQYGQIIRAPSDLGYNSIVGGNPELEPEKATTRTVGLVLEPRLLPGFNATIDWWSIDLDGAVEEIGAQAIFDTCIVTGDPFFCSRIHRDSDGSLWLSPEGFVDDRFANIGSIRVRGLDLGANYRRGVGRFGSLSAEFMGSLVDRFRVDNGGLSTPVQCAGKVGVACVHPTPRWRHKARLTWDTNSRVSLSLHWRHTGKMTVVPLPDRPPPGPLSRIPAQSYFDAAALIRPRPSFTVRLGVNNIFDREPPLVPAGEGAIAITGAYSGNTYPQWFDPLGRFLFAGFTATF